MKKCAGSARLYPGSLSASLHADGICQPLAVQQPNIHAAGNARSYRHPLPNPNRNSRRLANISQSGSQIIFALSPIWQTNGENRASGTGGFWQIESQLYARSLYDQLSHLCVQQANDPNLNTRYGEMPFIYDWQGWDIKQNFWFGYGCIVSPKLPQPGLESVLFARNPARSDELFILRADSTHFDGISSSLSFAGRSRTHFQRIL